MNFGKNKECLSMIACFIFVCCSCAQELNQSLINKIDSIGLRYHSTPGFSVLIAKGDNILYKNAYGLANHELSVPSKTTYSYAIGSLSKQFIAIAILKLVEEGKVSLDDRAIEYLAWLNTKEKNHVTIKHLLSHTSGIKDFFTNEDFVDYFVQPFSKENMMGYLAKEVESENFPGTKYKYSNAGYVYLSLIIENITNQPIEQYFQDTFFIPLEMNSTFWGNPNMLKKGTVTGYIISRDGKNTLLKESYLFANLNWVMGAGAIYSSVEDMHKWIGALLNNRIIKKETLQLAFKPYKLENGNQTNYGLGFETKKENERLIITHSGMINGFQSNMIIIPEEKIFGIALSNRMDFAPSFVYQIIKSLN